MTITFNINFHTNWGEQLYITGSIPELGGEEIAFAKEMVYKKDGNWQYELSSENIDADFIKYRYIVRKNDGQIKEEWKKGHTVSLDNKVDKYSVFDTWLTPPASRTFYTSAFTKAIFSHANESRNKPDTCNIVLQVSVPQVNKSQALLICGNNDLLGNWSPEAAPEMDCISSPDWFFSFDYNEITFPLEYKFAIVDKNNRSICFWESGENRILNIQPPDKGERVVVSVDGFHGEDKLPLWKGAGCVIPVFSLRSENSFGIGDLGDLKIFVDWAESTGQSLIQVLPMNDTRMTHSWLDSYPYSAMSIYAIHPMYIDLYKMGKLKDKARNSYYEQRQKELNANDVLDYEAVVECKIGYCHEYFTQEGSQKLLSTKDYKDFFEKNKSWLMPYAAYGYLRDLNKTSKFSDWKQFSVYNSDAVNNICSPENEAYEGILFDYYLQYVVDKQFREVTDYARANGISLKGDLPIGVNRYSAEVWTEPDFFNLDEQSGAPPDDFSLIGQNWLFPTYKWGVMEKDEFSWWRKRFGKMNDFFDSYRIDHILGFFRIWEIPAEHVQGLCGHFNPALPLTTEEMKEKYGFFFEKERFTNPHINKVFLPEIFGEYTNEVTDTYLIQSSSNHFVLKPFCDTQRKIEALFYDKNDDKSTIIKNGLYRIATEVLFLEDSKEKSKYHPRISSWMSYIYKELSDEERNTFKALYEDFYYHRHNEFWKEQALKKLVPLINSTDMLVCGEDLGMIPQTVPEVMNQLQILSLEIERMPKESGVEFTDLTNLPYLSVCTTSTHDMTPIRSWWKEDFDKTQRYYNSILRHEGKAPEECSTELAEQIISNHLTSDAMLTIVPLQDWLAISDRLKRKDEEAERINIPAQTNFYWRYRMHITIEDLQNSNDFNEKVLALVKDSGR